MSQIRWTHSYKALNTALGRWRRYPELRQEGVRGQAAVQHFYEEWGLEGLGSELMGMRPEWQHDAACRGQTELFFGEHASHAEAKQLCSVCPVFEQCADYAATWYPRELAGIWAGTSQRERLKNWRQLLVQRAS